MRTIHTWPLLVGVVALAAACVPVDRRAADRAEDECRAEARAGGFRAIDTSGETSGLGDNVVVAMRAERDGREYSGNCVYDRSSRRARVDLQRGEGGEAQQASRASEACRLEARDRGYDVRRVGEIRHVGDSVRVSLDLRRKGKSYDGYCRYEDRRADLEISS